MKSAPPIHKRESFLLVMAAAVLVVGVLAFIGIAELTFADRLVGFDRWGLLAFRSPTDLGDPIGSRVVEHYVRDLTALGGSFVLTLFTVLAVAYLLVSRRPATAAFVAIVVAVNASVMYALKLAYGRLRPDFMGSDPLANSPAFPSGHAMSSAAVYLTIGLVLTTVIKHRWQRVFVLVVSALFTLAIGTSRVYRGGALADRCSRGVDARRLLGRRELVGLHVPDAARMDPPTTRFRIAGVPA